MRCGGGENPSSGELGNFTLQSETVTIYSIQCGFLGNPVALTVGGVRPAPGIECERKEKGFFKGEK